MKVRYVSKESDAGKLAFEGLQRLYEEACTDGEEHGRVCAKVLLGLYNGSRFPFDLTLLRTLSHDLFLDAMALIELDATTTCQEIHAYFDDGGRKFEALAEAYRVTDVLRLVSSHAA